MTKCIIGTCQRQGDRVVEGQARCAEHAAQLAEALARERAALERDQREATKQREAAKRPARRNILGTLKRRIGVMEVDRSGKEPLLVRFLRRRGLGRRPLSGADVVADVGQVIDLVELEDQGVLTGSSGVSAENFARELCLRDPPLAELVNAADRERIKRKPAYGRR